MPGPVSDSYDPEFSTGTRAQAVRDGIQEVIDAITEELGPGLHDIVQVAEGEAARQTGLRINDRHARLIRFGLLRALESL